MKILFVRLFSVTDEIIMPLHFGYLASSIDPRHEVVILDQLRHKIPEEELIGTIVKERPDVVGFSAYTRDIFKVKNLMSRIKPILPEAKMVLGGVQISLMPQETYEYLWEHIDYGFIGESEIAFSEFIEALDGDDLEARADSIHNLVWRRDGRVIVNPKAIIEDLDEIPFPKWELMPPQGYPKAPHGAFYKKYPYAPMITSRGCPYPCTFCSAGALSGKKVRYRSVENVIDEIKYLQKDFGVKEIHIEDDNFSMKKERVISFSERLLKEDLGISWAFPNGLRLDTLDLETMKLMRKAGCYAVNVGVESGDEERLKKIRKKTTRDRIRVDIAMAKEAGMDIGGFFIIGFPGETLEEMNNTIDFAPTLELDRIGISYFQPYPGSEEYRKLCESGEYIFDFDTSEHSLHTISYVPRGVTEKQIEKMRFKGFMKFYFRVKIMIKLLREVKSFEHFKFILKRGLRWLTN